MSDEIEGAIDDLLIRFVALQDWGKKGGRPEGMYKLILALDEKIKLLRKRIKEGGIPGGPLLDLVKEIRDGFDTKEYRAALLDAFNWRSAQRAQIRAKEIEQKKLRDAESKLKQKSNSSKKQKNITAIRSSRITSSEPRLSYHEMKRQEEMKQQVMKAFLSFIEQNETRLRREYEKKEELKIAHEEKQQRTFWRRRLPGSYGARN